MATWMNDVAAAWLMTSIGASPLWVALVQSASTLPLFLLGLPIGTLADLVDRRRYLIATQCWAAVVAMVLCGVMLLGAMTAPVLLGLTFAYGVATAMRWPVLAAVVAEAVPSSQIAQAFALNGIAMNASRIFGPLVAGALVASWGAIAVFALNAVMSVAMTIALWSWRPQGTQARSRASLGSAMGIGLKFVAASVQMRTLICHVACFAFHSTSTLALLPLVAQRIPGAGPGNYTLLLSCIGVGAIASAVAMPLLRERLALRDRLVAGTLGVACATTVVAVSTALWAAVVAMLVFGFAYLLVTNSLTVAAQLALEGWVRARGIAIYQMSLMGATAAGAAAWGQLAAWTSIPVSLGISAVIGLGVIGWLLFAMRAEAGA